MIKKELLLNLKKVNTDALINRVACKWLLHELQCGDVNITIGNERPHAKIVGSGHTESVKDLFNEIKRWYKEDALAAMAQIENAVLRLAIEWLLPRITEELEEFNHELFKNYPHYWFVRALRNAASHRMCFSFRGEIKNHLPIHWNGIEINAQLEGEELTQKIMSHNQVAKLITDIFEYVENTYPEQ